MQAPPLEWDTQGEYTRGSIEVYYLSNAAKPLDAEQLTEVCPCVPFATCSRQPRSLAPPLRVAARLVVSIAPLLARQLQR